MQTIEIDYQPDCPVCLQSCYYPVKLPCGHIFCYLCIKGVALRSRKCALCRHSLAPDYLESPLLVKVVDGASKREEASKSKEDSQEYGWYYEGRDGWWLYDEKTSAEVEKAFKGGQRSCTLLIAGFLYVVDFKNMFQTRKNEPGRRRRIKRDKRDVESKGVAGIRIPATATGTFHPNAPGQLDSKAARETDDSQIQTATESSTEDRSTSVNTETQVSSELPDVEEIRESLEETSL